MSHPALNIPQTRVACEFELHLKDRNHNTRQIVNFTNLITDAGLDMIGTNTSDAYLNVCRLGSGSVTPAFTDTVLGNQIASADRISSTYGGSDTAPVHSWGRYKYSFAPGSATGNISEIGISNSGTATLPLFSRALIKDALGNPITLTILADDYLDVFYTVRLYTSPDVTSFSVVDGANTITGTIQALETGTGIVHISYRFYRNCSYQQLLGSANGPIINNVPSAKPAYINGSYSLTSVFKNLPSAFSSTDIKTFIVYNGDYAGDSYRIVFDTPLTKLNNQSLTITIKQSWGRYV